MTEKIKLIFDPVDKNANVVEKARELQKREGSSLVSNLVMLNDAKDKKIKIFKISIKTERKEIPKFIFL